MNNLKMTSSTVSTSIGRDRDLELAEDIIDYSRQYEKCRWWQIEKKLYWLERIKRYAGYLNKRKVGYIRINKIKK